MKKGNDDRQWAVICGNALVRTYGREKGSQKKARDDARESRGWGYKAVLLKQQQIDRLD